MLHEKHFYCFMQNAQRMMLGSWGHRICLKEELRCALISVGILCVMMDGDQRMPKLFADNSDTQPLVGEIL